MASRNTRKPKVPENDETGGRLDASSVDLGDLPRLAGLYLRVLSPIMSARIDKMMAAHPVGTGQGKTSTLQVIAKNPGISQMELSEIFGRDRSAQSRIVSDLERRKLIRREVDPTQRHRYKLYATDRGADLVLGLEAMARENERQIFHAISDQEYETIRKLLLRVVRSHLGAGAAYWPGPDDPA
jgi:DNA-binding MarR family transcriptional regulator